MCTSFCFQSAVRARDLRFVLLLSFCFAGPLVGAAEDEGRAVAKPVGESAGGDSEEALVAKLKFVRESVLPLLEARCFECHKQGAEVRGGLMLSSRQAMLNGGESGPAIVPGKPDESLLVEAVRYESFEMPPRTRMPKQEVDILVRWIAEGAIWPEELNAAPPAAHDQFPLHERRQSHWAWQPISQPDVPAVKADQKAVADIDAFILQKLDEHGLQPAAATDRRTLLRRLHFDITGLPPTIEEIEAFVRDARDDAAATADVVDRLLASPHYGERWGRHWLDLVRYGETLGHEFDYPLHNAWRYRDYVIRALNADVSYDQFVKEHIAGDLLPEPRRHPTDDYNESIIGTGFWFLNEDKHAPVDVRAEEAAKIDNRIDVFSKTFLGMTVACARCHDHKFDAISTADYYALAGFLQSSRRQTAWLDPGRKIQQQVRQLQAVRQQATNIAQQRIAADLISARLHADILAAWAAIPVAPAAPVKEGAAKDGAAKDGAAADSAPVQPEQRWNDLLKQASTAAAQHPLSLLAAVAQAPADAAIADVGRAWQARVKSRISAESQDTADGNTVRFADLSHGLPDGWFTAGAAFADGVARQTGVAANGLQCCKSGVEWNDGAGVSSASLAKQLRGTLSSPTFELQHPEILVKVAGQASRVRLVIDGYQMNEFSELLFRGARQKIDTEGAFKWIRLAGDVHRYQGHKVWLEFLDEGRGWFAVQEIRFAKTPGANPESADRVNLLNQTLANDTKLLQCDSREAVATFWQQAAAKHLPTASAAALLNAGMWTELTQDAAWMSALQKWQSLAEATPKRIPVIAMTDGTPEDERVFIRGNHRNLGSVVPRNLLTALQTPDAEPDTQGNLFDRSQGSGRLQLAEQLVADTNPLTSRVAVNRVWHHLFGAGLVTSTDNFGVLGRSPSHPELLDYLAHEFRSNGWSLKTLIRKLVLTETYRASSQSSEQAKQVDPTNQWLQHARIRRLQGEAVRDAMLLVSGRLDRTLYGPSVPVHLTAFMQGRGRPGNNGPVDGNGRRSIYLSVNRNFLSPFMQAFDVPAPVTTTGKRTTSNVPAQALILLNNEFVNQQAALWAQRLLTGSAKPMESTIDRAWYELLGRPATEEERQLLLSFATNQLPEGEAGLTVAVLTDVCHVLLNAKEFLFLK